MIGLAISILWFALGVIILAAIIFVALWGIKSISVPIPPRVEQLVWVVFLILVLIYLLMTIQGGGRAPFRISQLLPGPTYAASAPVDMYGMLGGYCPVDLSRIGNGRPQETC